MSSPKSLKSIRLNFFERGGAYWVAVTLITDDGETVMETECDTKQIQFNFEEDISKADLN